MAKPPKPKEYTISVTHVVQPEQYHSLRVEHTVTYEVVKDLDSERAQATEDVEGFVARRIRKQLKQWNKLYKSEKK